MNGVMLNGLIKLESFEVDFEETGWRETGYGPDREGKARDLIREKPREQEEVRATDAIRNGGVSG